MELITEDASDEEQDFDQAENFVLCDEKYVYGTKTNPPVFPFALSRHIPKSLPPVLPDELFAPPPGCPRPP